MTDRCEITEREKTPAIDKSVEDCIGVVVDPRHARFGQLGEIILHDWREGGTYLLHFDDNGVASFYDGWDTDRPIPEALALRRVNEDIGSDMTERLREAEGRLRDAINIGRCASVDVRPQEFAALAFYRVLEETHEGFRRAE